MSKITNEVIQKVAALAKLSFDDQATVAMAQDMQKILSYIDTLSSVDTDDISAQDMQQDQVRDYRPDDIGTSLTIEAALANAPSTSGRTFKVPRVLGDGS